MNRAKVIATAHKYLAKGNLRRAVKEYEKVLKEDPSDIRTKLKVADLLFRLGEKDHATATFEEVAKFYSSQGFLLKSVAVYKQVQKLKPDDVDVHLALAGLYQQIGLITDAISQYRKAIALQEAAGANLERLKTARRMLELDPDNARLRVALAEDLSREGMIEDAVHEFRVAAESLRKSGLQDEYLLVAERLLYHQPDDYEVSKTLSAYYIAQRDGLKALARLQTCYKVKPTDPEVLDLLAQVFEFLGQPQKAVTVLKSLAREYDRTGLIRDRDEVFRRVLKLSPEDRDARDALQFVPAVEGQSGSEIEFESGASRPPPEEILIPDEEEIDIDELVEATSPEAMAGRDRDIPRDDGGSPEPGSEPISVGDIEPEVTLVDHGTPLLPEGSPSPAAQPLDLGMVPAEFQDDIQNLEFLVDAGLREEAAELIQDVRRRGGGELPILKRFETLLATTEDAPAEPG